MSPDEVKAGLEALGIKITRRTLVNYETQKLIPEATHGSAGRGKGRFTDYPDDTVSEAYASYNLIHGRMKIPPEMAVAARRKALAMERSIIVPDIKDHLRIAWDSSEESLWVRWLVLKYEAQDPSGETQRRYTDRANVIYSAVITASGLLKTGIDEGTEKRIIEMSLQVAEEDRGTFIKAVQTLIAAAAKKI